LEHLEVQELLELLVLADPQEHLDLLAVLVHLEQLVLAALRALPGQLELRVSLVLQALAEP